MAFLNETGLQRLLVNLRSKLVPQTRTINDKALSSDIVLTYDDIGPLPPAPFSHATLTQAGIINFGIAVRTLPAGPGNNWIAGNPNTRSIDVAGMSENHVAEMWLIPSASDPTLAAQQLAEWSRIGNKLTINSVFGAVIISCYGDYPSIALPIYIRGML